VSFDLFFMPHRSNGATKVVTNPFTKVTRVVAASDSLTKAEVAAVQALLRPSAHAEVAHDNEFISIDFPDGGSAEVSASDLETGCMVSLRGMTPDVCTFLHALLVAGNWVVTPAMEDAVAIAATPCAFEGDSPSGYPPRVICATGEELGALLRGGVTAWGAYRDAIASRA
jgi:hypothetical protein